MIKNFFFAIIFLVSVQMYSQETNQISNYGKTFPIENADLLLKKDKVYKVIFDVFKDGTKTERKNASIETVARFINMHVEQGVPLKNLKIVLVLHGAAAKNSLNDTTYQKAYKHNNPNSELLSALKEANVLTYVCGQSLAFRGHNKSHVSKDVQVSLSALTALVHYQALGYQQINFN